METRIGKEFLVDWHKAAKIKGKWILEKKSREDDNRIDYKIDVRNEMTQDKIENRISVSAPLIQLVPLLIKIIKPICYSTQTGLLRGVCVSVSQWLRVNSDC